MPFKKGYKPTKEHRMNLSKSRKGYKMTEEQKIKISMTMKNRGIEPINKFIGYGSDNPFYGKKHTKETIEIIRQKKLGQKHTEETKALMSRNQPKGCNHYKWKEDRSTLKKSNRRNDPAYKEWRLNVYKRDNYKCIINNEDCNGRIEAHHILGWHSHPNLRYNINNCEIGLRLWQ